MKIKWERKKKERKEIEIKNDRKKKGRRKIRVKKISTCKEKE